MDCVIVSLSASTLEVRQRVAVNTDAGWFLGTVKIVKTKYATVLFDDGDTAEVLKTGGASDFRLLPPNVPKSKKAYKLKEVRELIEAAPVERKIPERKTSPKRDYALDTKHHVHKEEPVVTALPPKPVVPKMRVIGAPREKSTAPVPDHKPVPENMVNSDPMEQMRVVYETKIRGSTNIPDCRRFLLDLWTVYNKQKFGGQLRPIKKFLVIPASGRYGIRAFWHGTYRILVFTNLVMKANWDKFSEIFGHELCHQAVTDVDHNGVYSVGAEGGHGPDWQAWMHKIGLEPKRYDDSTFSEYMTDSDKALFDKNADDAMSAHALHVVRKENHLAEFKARKLIPAKNAQVGSLITLSLGSTEEAPEGVVEAITNNHGRQLYRIRMYTEETRGQLWGYDPTDPDVPMFFLKEPKAKYRSAARRLVEELRKTARKEGRLR